MLTTRGALSVVIAVLLLAVVAPAASAVPCGSPPAAGGDPTVGELSLNDDAVDDTNLDFKGDNDPRDIALIFTVTGCTLGRSSDIAARPVGNESDAIELGPAEPKGDSVVFTGKVTPEKFKAGKHTPSVVVSSAAGEVKTLSFKVTLQRKDGWLVPTGLAFVGLLAGFGYAVALAAQNAIAAYDKQKAEHDQAAAAAGGPAPAPAGGQAPDKVDYQAGYLLGALVAAGALAYAAYNTGYTNSDTWGADAPSVIALFFAVAAAAAGGAAVGLLKGVTTAPVPSPPPSPPAE